MRKSSVSLFAGLFLICILLVSCEVRTNEKAVPVPQETKEISENGPVPNFLHLSDVHLNTFVSTCTYGDDTGTQLWANTRSKLKSVLSSENPPKFIVYTGDLPAHYECESSCFIPVEERDTHNKNISVILNDMRDLVKSNGIPFFYMPGNNDALAGDYYSFADAKQQTPFSLVPDPELPYPALHASQPCGAAPCMVADPHPTMGYYVAKPLKGLRLICLNSIILGRKYHEVDGVSHSDAGDTQMNWFGEQLQAAADVGDKVYIAMHIPPGEDAYAVSHDKDKTWMWAHLPSQEDSWQNDFLASIEAHQTTVAGLLYGHTHMDELRRLHAPADDAVMEIALSAPGITPQHYNNPGFKQVEFDPQSMEILDFVTWYSTPEATKWGSESYRFSDEFGCRDQSILECIAGRSNEDLVASMNKIYTVKHGEPSYATGSGIEVRKDQ